MATPAVLLLGNAMLILSTNQRLQAILTRLSELELALERHQELDERVFRRLAERHRRRARYAHRALLAFYASSGLFVLVVLAIGADGFGLPWGSTAAVVLALFGCVVLAIAVVHLVTETWMGLSATDEQFRRLGHPNRRSDD